MAIAEALTNIVFAPLTDKLTGVFECKLDVAVP